ncbi:MAG: ABC transporter ATP-binding protein [Betaproteobacteria bacterium]|nr:ABC transporter ATP-binding protein [Betaproteobacteria bacterium]MSQ88578.1 ABC transporter ATP-binding protein [Betaproteobacteria bacterium]
MFLKAENISKSFGGVRAVQNVSLEVPENSIFALIGPNGAGKSTLLNLLSGIYQPDAGQLTFQEKNLIGLPAHRRVRLGLARTFQKIRLFKQLTLLENVRAGFHIHQDAPFWKNLLHGNSGSFRDEAHELLEFVGLESLAGERAGALPYGKQRLLEIARALATRPRLFMLDEPAAGLNGSEVDFLLDRLIQIAGRGITLVVVEHNMDLVMNVAQRVFVMDHGEQLFEGAPREVQANPRVIEAYLGGEFQ